MTVTVSIIQETNSKGAPCRDPMSRDRKTDRWLSNERRDSSSIEPTAEIVTKISRKISRNSLDTTNFVACEVKRVSMGNNLARELIADHIVEGEMRPGEEIALTGDQNEDSSAAR